MSCIVGMVDHGDIYMGADASCSEGTTLYPIIDPKVFAKGGFLIGCCGKFRVIQTIHHSFVPPDIEQGSHLERYMNIDFVNAARATLREAGHLRNELGLETVGATMVVGREGRLFVVGESFEVTEISAPFTSVGSGQDVALGALYALERETNLHPAVRIQRALEAAEMFTCNVRSPYIIMKMDREGVATQLSLPAQKMKRTTPA